MSSLDPVQSEHLTPSGPPPSGFNPSPPPMSGVRAVEPVAGHGSPRIPTMNDMHALNDDLDQIDQTLADLDAD